MTSSQVFLFFASAMAVFSFLVHTFVGGRFAVTPLLQATGLPKATVWLNYFTWHITTLLLLILAASFALGAAGRLHPDAVMLSCAIAAMISALSIAVTLKAGIRPWRFPASYLLGATALMGLIGVLKG